jgi:hypothetical protein
VVWTKGLTNAHGRSATLSDLALAGNRDPVTTELQGMPWA